MKHKSFIIITLLVLLTQNIKAQNLIYTSDRFLLNLDESDSSFTFYSKELSLELTVSGDLLIKNDSLILSTHQIENEAVVFAIFLMSRNYLTNIYKQEAFYKSIPDQFYLLKKIHANGSIAQENYWNSYIKGQYEKYEFDENKNILSLQNYNNFKLDGKQLIFLGDKETTVSFELRYKNGRLHGKSFYYRKLEEVTPKVELIKIEKYKKGKLRRTKKPVKSRVFYTSHS